MATTRAANLVEKATKREQAPLTTDVSNFSQGDYGDSTQQMKALTWQGKNKVKIGKSTIVVIELHEPKLIRLIF
jgi:hypothetical protein